MFGVGGLVFRVIWQDAFFELPVIQRKLIFNNALCEGKSKRNKADGNSYANSKPQTPNPKLISALF